MELVDEIIIINIVNIILHQNHMGKVWEEKSGEKLNRASYFSGLEPFEYNFKIYIIFEFNIYYDVWIDELCRLFTSKKDLKHKQTNTYKHKIRRYVCGLGWQQRFHHNRR